MNENKIRHNLINYMHCILNVISFAVKSEHFIVTHENNKYKYQQNIFLINFEILGNKY